MSFVVVRALRSPFLDFSDQPSLTRQEFAQSADINHIVNHFLRTGQISFPNAGRPMIDGLEAPGDFTEACNMAYEQRHEEVVNNANEEENSSGSVSHDGVQATDSQGLESDSSTVPEKDKGSVETA